MTTFCFAGRLKKAVENDEAKDEGEALRQASFQLAQRLQEPLIANRLVLGSIAIARRTGLRGRWRAGRKRSTARRERACRHKAIRFPVSPPACSPI